MSFQFDVTDAELRHAANTKIELRIYNADGVPAQRVKIGMDEVDWDPTLRG